MMKQFLIIITLALLKFRPVTCVANASITTIPASLNGNICPTTVQMTCMTSDLTTLRWFIDDVDLLIYAYSTGDESRLPFTLSITLPISPGLEIAVTSVAPSTVNRDLFDATSTLTTNITLLQAFNMQDFTCGTFETRSETVTVNFNILGPSSTSSATCSLVTSASGLNVSLQWSSSFNSLHAVERYRVSVDPDPSSSCSSDQVMPSEDYSCLGLSPERNYSITVSAINCGDQEGESNTFTVLPQLLGPQTPRDATVISDPDIDGRLTVTWMESITISGKCSFSGAINYTLILEDSAGDVVEERVVSSDSSCSNGSCSSSFSPSSQICRVSIMANNTFGESNPAIAIINPDRLTTDNQILLAVGVVLLCVAFATAVILIVLRVHIKGTIMDPLSLVMLVIGVVVIVVPVVLWVAVGFIVRLQNNTCDSNWQLTRNNLIISAFIFSLLCTIVILTFSAFAAVICGKKSTVSQGLQKSSMDSKRSSKAMNIHGQAYGRFHEPVHVQLVEVHKELGIGETNLKAREKVEEGLDPHYAKTQHTAEQLAPLEQPSQYSHIQIEVAKTEEDTHYHSLDHKKGKGKIASAASFQAQPAYGQLGTHSLPICTTMYTADLKYVAEWFQCDRKWPITDLNKSKKLSVFFMNECPNYWKYNNNKISCDVIMKFLKESWKYCFVIADRKEKNPYIRVKFQDKASGNWSAIGSEAKHIGPQEPTMVLDFSNMSNNEIMATVIHQFGHALGLGHALMKPDDWNALKPFLDLHRMMSSCGASTEENLEDQWTGKKLKRSTVNYDEDSIMKHSFSISWLKLELPRNIKELLYFEKKEDLSSTDKSFLNVIKLAPPRYDLEPDVVIALKGGSARMNFTVTSDHKMPRIIKHTIKREDGTTVIKFEVSEEFVTFSEVKTNDSGIYTISCHNDYGTVGKESFELLVVPDRPKYVFMCDSMVDGNTVESFVGVKVVIPFRVALCENTTLNERARHRVTKVDGTNRSKIKENCIIFSNVKKSDEGTYKITCHDNNVIEGEFKLNVSVGTSPVYTLECERVVTMAGSSPTINFTVKCQPPFSKEPVHRVIKEEKFFTLNGGNIITFHDVEVSDTGLWVIQCINNTLIGKESFMLEVYSPGTDVDITPLTEEAFADVVEDLKDVLPRYYNIGEKLGLPSSTLREIMNENLDSYSAMTLIIKCWLKDRDRCKDLTWKSLVEAVAHKKGGNNVALAMKLTDKHRVQVADEEHKKLQQVNI